MTPRAIKTARVPNGEWYAAEVDWDLGRPQGWGKTELEAIQDLEDQLSEEKYNASV